MGKKEKQQEMEDSQEFGGPTTRSPRKGLLGTFLAALFSFLLLLAIDLANLVRDVFLWAHSFLVRHLERFASNLESEKSVPSLRYLFFSSNNPDAYIPPPPEQMDRITSLYKEILDPQFYGLENIPNDRPVLFIGNHALFALEFPLMLSRLYSEKGIFVRAAGDYLHAYLPYWPLYKYFGAIEGSKENCERIMKSKGHLLIFPGGGREVLKRKSDPKYELMWKERVGFARLAIKHGYSIIPFASYGTEDMVDILFDIPLKPILGREMFLPIPKPPHPNKIQRIYYSFGKPISSEEFQGNFESMENCRKLRDLAKQGVEEQIAFLKEQQQNDPHSKRLPSLLNKIFPPPE